MSQAPISRQIDQALIDKFKDLPEFRQLSTDERGRILDNARRLVGLPTRMVESNVSAARGVGGDSTAGALYRRYGSSAAQTTQSLSNLLGIENPAFARDESGMSALDYMGEAAGQQLKENLGETAGGLAAGAADLVGGIGDPVFAAAGAGLGGLAAKAGLGATAAGVGSGATRGIASIVGREASKALQQRGARIAQTALLAGATDAPLGAAIGYERTGTLEGAATEGLTQGATSLLFAGSLQGLGEAIGAARRALASGDRNATARALREARRLTAEAGQDRASLSAQERVLLDQKKAELTQFIDDAGGINEIRRGGSDEFSMEADMIDRLRRRNEVTGGVAGADEILAESRSALRDAEIDPDQITLADRIETAADAAAARSGVERFAQSEAIRRAPKPLAETEFLAKRTQAIRSNDVNKNPLVATEVTQPYNKPVPDPTTGRAINDPRPQFQPKPEDSIVYLGSGVPVTSANMAKVVRGVDSLTSLWQKPLLDRLDTVKTPKMQEFVGKARQAVDEARDLIQAQWQPKVSAYLKKVNGAWATRKQRNQRGSVMELSDLELSDDGTYAFTKFARAVEDDAALAGLSDGAKQIVSEYRGLNRMMSLAGEKAGLTIELADGTKVPFKAAEGGNRLVRRPTSYFFDILSQGDRSEAFQEVARAIAKANNIPDHRVVIRELNRLAPSRSVRTAAIEHARTLPVMPTHVKVKGQWVQIIDADPYYAAVGMSHSFGHRIGFHKSFGGDFTETVAQQFADEIVGETQNPALREQITDAMRGLSGAPIETPIFRTGSTLYNATDVAMVAESAARSLERSLSIIPNLPETVQKVPAYNGLRRYMRALAKVAVNNKDLRVEVGRLGAYTDHIAKWYVSPGRALQDLRSMSSEAFEALSLIANDLNEYISAASAAEMITDLKAGRATSADRIRLEIMDFSPDQIEIFLTGKADDKMYRVLAQRSVARTQGVNAASVERSRASNSRAYGAVVAHDSYAQFTANRTIRVVDKLLENPSDLGAWRVFGEYFTGSVIGGASALALRSAVFGGGVYGLYALGSYAWDDKAGFLMDTLTQSMLGGPPLVLMEAAAGSSKIDRAEQIVNTVSPYRHLDEFYAFAKGTDRYRGMDFHEKLATYAQRIAPIARGANEQISYLYFGERPARMKAAERAYYQYLRDEGLNVRVARGAADDGRFSYQVRQAVEVMKKGGDNAQVVEHIKKALQVDDTRDLNSVINSLRSRKKLSGSPFGDDAEGLERLQALRKRIGETAFQTLVEHDAMIDAWIDAIR